MTGYLTTHVLDTAKGYPAAGLRVQLYRIEGDVGTKIAETLTNSDGRTDSPILPQDSFELGTYELVFHAGDYLRAHDMPSDFLDKIPLRFSMKAEDHYHVPLLLSPYSFSTYRGS